MAFEAAAPALITAAGEMSAAKWAFTWEPVPSWRRRAMRRLGFVANPLGRGPFSYRVPLITRSDRLTVNGAKWAERESFDLQPIMQD